MANPKRFIYSTVNPLAAYPDTALDPRFHNKPLQADDSLCYFQKIQQNDGIKSLVVLSDWVPNCIIYDNDGAVYATPLCALVNTTIIGQTFKMYQIDIDFSLYAVGRYQGVIQYTDDNNVLQQWIIRPFEVAVDWPETLLIQYKNDDNAFDMIFNTGLLFWVRIEGSLLQFNPEFNGNTFTDQAWNATRLPSVPFQTKILSLGHSPGLPDYMGNVLNYIMLCTYIQIESEAYQTVEGEKWQVQRPELGYYGERVFSNYSIKVMLVDNASVERLKNGNVALNGYTPFTQVEEIDNVASDQTILFRNWALIREIIVKQNTVPGIAFTLNVGITPGGTEIGQFEIGTDDKVCEFRHLFTASPYNIYLSGLSGVAGLNVSLRILWTDLNAKPQNAPAPVGTFGHSPGDVFIYEEVHSGDFLNDFDLTTGKGKTTGNYPTCVICDGRNGTAARGGKYTIGWINGDINFGTPGATVGKDHINMTDASQLPNFHLVYQRGTMNAIGFQYDSNVARGGSNVGMWSGIDADTSSIGASADIPIQPIAIVSIWVKCVA